MLSQLVKHANYKPMRPKSRYISEKTQKNQKDFAINRAKRHNYTSTDFRISKTYVIKYNPTNIVLSWMD